MCCNFFADTHFLSTRYGDMLEIKNNTILIALMLFMLAFIINLFLGEPTTEKESTLQNKMQNAMEDQDHENAFLFASRLLEVEPDNQQAVKVIKNSGEILLFLQIAQSSIAELERDTDKLMDNPEKVYENFKIARVYASKAKFLDVDFETTVNFEKSLDEAQTYMLNMLAAKVLDVGEKVYSNVSNNYKKKSAIIQSASASGYLDIFLAVQSSWAPVETSVNKNKKDFNPLLEKMNNTGRLISGNRSGGQAENLSDSLLTYIQAVRNATDALVIPKGSYKDFNIAATSSITYYENAHKMLKRHLSGTANVNNFSKLVKTVARYKLFQNKSIGALIKENEHLQARVAVSY